MNCRSFFVFGVALAILSGRWAMAIEPTADTLDSVKQRLARHEAVLIDVRDKSEWDRGHLSDAIWFPLGDLRKVKADAALREKLAKAAPAGRIVYCHCAKGIRALTAGSILEGMGYDARPLAAGFDDLRNAGFPAAENTAGK